MRNNVHNRPAWGLVALALLAGAPPALAENNAPVTAGVFVDRSQAIVLTPGVFAQLLVKRNAEVAGSALAISITQNLLDAENGLYEPVAFGDLRKERRHRLNTVEEQIVSSELPILDEKVYSADMGLKLPLPTGGNAKFDYQVEDRINNVIANQSQGLYNSEYTGSLGLTIEQPLFRGAGKSVTETESRSAEFDFKIAKEKFKQQVFKSLSSGLDAYWQLYKAQRVLALRQDVLDQVRRLQDSTRARIAAGKAAPSTLMEVQSMALSREIDYSRARQSMLDAATNMMSLLGMKRVSEPHFKLVPEVEITDAFVERTTRSDDAADDMTRRWPAYVVAELEMGQAEVKAAYFKDLSKPVFTLLMNYQSTGFAYERDQINPEIRHHGYPDWFVGISIEQPVAGNVKSSSQYLAQRDRMTQLELEKDGITVAHHNEFLSTQEQLQVGTHIVEQSRADLALRQQLFDNETERFKLGSIPYAALAQKENDLVEAKVRVIENESRLEYSKFLYLYYRDVALEAYNIHLDN
jgi:outer membrane protein TolC